MPFFDFHCHPGMKSRLAPQGKEPSPWTSIKVQLEILGSIRLNISPAFADALDSQASLHQLWQGGVNLIGLIIHSIESNVASQLLKKSIVRNGNILQLDPVKIQRSANGNEYYKITREELQWLLDNANPPAAMGLPQGTTLKIIRSISEYDSNDMNTIHAILILEGAQNFFDNPDEADFREQFMRNLDDLASQFRIFAINPCHFQQMPIANQAFAMQFLRNEPFFPTERGITEWGFEVITEIYNRGILVDTKHMGLHTRHELYRIRQEQGITLPIICSHAGVTGISEMERLKYFYHESPLEEDDVWQVRFLKKWGHVKDTAYNMSSLGLYDEDIEQIIISGGMIGISLDQRIIGFPANEPLEFKVGIFPTDLEYISKKEADVFFGPQSPATCLPRKLDNNEVMNFDDAESQNAGDTAGLHALYFLNQIVHILFVAKKSQRGITVEDAKKSICIGSDMDGLINPLDCCMNVADYGKFKTQLTKIMGKKSFWKGTGFSFGEINGSELLDAIFFKNAEAFLNKNFI